MAGDSGFIEKGVRPLFRGAIRVVGFLAVQLPPFLLGLLLYVVLPLVSLRATWNAERRQAVIRRLRKAEHRWQTWIFSAILLLMVIGLAVGDHLFQAYGSEDVPFEWLTGTAHGPGLVIVASIIGLAYVLFGVRRLRRALASHDGIERERADLRGEVMALPRGRGEWFAHLLVMVLGVLANEIVLRGYLLSSFRDMFRGFAQPELLACVVVFGIGIISALPLVTGFRRTAIEQHLVMTIIRFASGTIWIPLIWALVYNLAMTALSREFMLELAVADDEAYDDSLDVFAAHPPTTPGELGERGHPRPIEPGEPKKGVRPLFSGDARK